MTTGESAFLTSANAQGARGYRFFSPMTFDDGSVDGFVHDGASTYVFEGRPLAADSAAMATQLNSMGAQGYRWQGPTWLGRELFEVYRNDEPSSLSYSYTVSPVRASVTDYVSDLNSQGASGYYATSHFYSIGSGNPMYVVFEKASNAAVYAYEALAEPTNDAQYLEQLNAQGARGYRFRGSFYFDQGSYLVYEKDTTQSATFVFSALSGSTTSSAFVAQANAQGQAGAAFVSGLVLPSGANVDLFVTPSNCTGVLCVTRSPFAG